MTVPRLHHPIRHPYAKYHRRKAIPLLGVLAAATLLLISRVRSPSSSLVRYREDESLPAYDVVVIGSGPAGLTAALYASRSGWNVLLFGSLADSQLAKAQVLDNFPSSGMNGLQWLQSTRTPLQNVHFAQPTLQVSGLAKEGSLWRVRTDDAYVHARAVIVATGSVPRRLALQNEDKLWGKHVHSCAICDGSAYSQNQTVVVVGGGDAAVDAALLLSRQVRKVIVVHRRTTFRASNRRNIDLMQSLPNIEIRKPYDVSEYQQNGNELVGVRLKQLDTEASQPVACDGVFLLLGSTPNTKFLKHTLQLEDGYIRLHGSTQTSSPGIFAAGDVADRIYHQAVTAAGTGAQAALDAESYLRQTKARRLPQTAMPLQRSSIPRTTAETKTSADETPVDEGCDMTQPGCIRTIVSKYAVVVFSKPWCPYCRKALEAFHQENVDPHVINLTDNNTARRIQLTLASMTGGRTTVPNVFVGGTSIGGGDETVALHRSGELQPLLIAAKAL